MPDVTYPLKRALQLAKFARRCSRVINFDLRMRIVCLGGGVTRVRILVFADETRTREVGLFR